MPAEVPQAGPVPAARATRLRQRLLRRRTSVLDIAKSAIRPTNRRRLAHRFLPTPMLLLRGENLVLRESTVEEVWAGERTAAFLARLVGELTLYGDNQRAGRAANGLGLDSRPHAQASRCRSRYLQPSKRKSVVFVSSASEQGGARRTFSFCATRCVSIVPRSPQGTRHSRTDCTNGLILRRGDNASIERARRRDRSYHPPLSPAEQIRPRSSCDLAES